MLKTKIENSSRAQEIPKLWEKGNWQGEVQYLRKDGTYFLVEVNATIIKDANGKKTGIVTVARDITERKWAEEALAFQASLLSNSHDGMAAADENYIITYWNKAAEKLLGWAVEEVIGKTSKDIFQTKVPGSSRKEAIEKMLRNNEYDGEVFYKRKDGTYICTHVRTTVLRGLQGEFKGTISAFQILPSVSLRRRLYERMKSALLPTWQL